MRIDCARDGVVLVVVHRQEPDGVALIHEIIAESGEFVHEVLAAPVAQRHQRQRTAAVVAEVFENGAAFGGVDDVAVDAKHRIRRHLDSVFTPISRKSS